MKLISRNSGMHSVRIAFALLALAVGVFAQGCNHSRSTSFASHKVTVNRHGITNRFGVEDRDKLAIFRYDGFGAGGTRLKVTIENERVSINDKVVGMLKVGDAVHIGDEGLAVNDMDYGQSEKYLKANNTGQSASL